MMIVLLTAIYYTNKKIVQCSAWRYCLYQSGMLNIAGRVLLFMYFLFSAHNTFATIDTIAPAASIDPADLAEYHDLIKELRCPKCTNQSLADSSSLVSGDLRRIVLDRLQQGDSPEEVKRFLIKRYGDFIVYRPPLQSNTLLLWAIPGVLFFTGVAIVVYLARRHRAQTH